MSARQFGKYNEATRLLEHVEDWHRKQTFPSWQDRVWWAALLGEARKLIDTPPPMPKVAVGD